jgi:hypothetical protein
MALHLSGIATVTGGIGVIPLVFQHTTDHESIRTGDLLRIDEQLEKQ